MNMKQSLKLMLPLAAAALPLALVAPAQAAGGTTYHATLNALNHATGSGNLTLTLNGNQATIHETFSGLAAKFSGAPYPHVQHIHIDGMGQCPTTAADKNGDGVISTTEGAPQYGPIGTTLSESGDTSPAAGTNLKVAPTGASTNYSRTITLDAKTLNSVKNGKAVIVVHGLDPATLSKKAQGEKSDLVPALPLAATSPALCGALSAMPSGGPATGAGSTGGGSADLGLLVTAGGLLAAAGIAFEFRRRTRQGAAQA